MLKSNLLVQADRSNSSKKKIDFKSNFSLNNLSFRYSSIIPITFLTGFYVTQVVTRYWDQFVSLPWPDRLAYKLVSYIPGKVQFIKIYSSMNTSQRKNLNYVKILLFNQLSDIKCKADIERCYKMSRRWGRISWGV